MLFPNPAVNTMATSLPQNTANINSVKMSDQKKQERLELITYVKAHFDLIAVTLLVTYLAYTLYKTQNK